ATMACSGAPTPRPASAPTASWPSPAIAARANAGAIARMRSRLAFGFSFEVRMMEENQAIQLLFEEWKYLHDYFWRSLFRWAGAVVTLWVIPFIKPEIFKAWPKIVLFFPCMAFVLAVS